MKLKIILLGLVCVFSANNQVQAASCCGSGGSLPQLITTDSRAQLTTSLSRDAVIGDVSPSGRAVFRGDSNQEITQTFKIEGAYQLSELWQMGAGVPVVKRDRSFEDGSETTTGLGDLSLSTAFEFMPEYEYSPIKPRGFGFLQLTLPTSPSKYDSDKFLMTDARGRGFYTVTLGVSFVKVRGHFDFLASTEVHEALPRAFAHRSSIADGGYGFTAKPTPGVSASLGAGWSPRGGDFRMGATLAPQYEGPVELNGTSLPSTAQQFFWNSTLTVSYMIDREISSTLSYTDQTLVGPAQNAALSRIFALSVMKRWSL
jgi:hypothetical protein